MDDRNCKADLPAKDIQKIVMDDGTIISAFKSPIDGKTVVQIETHDTVPEDVHGDAVRVLYNDASAAKYEIDIVVDDVGRNTPTIFPAK